LGSPKQRAEFDLIGGGTGSGVSGSGKKPAYPADDIAQTVAVMAVLASGTGPLSADTIAVTFKQGRRAAPKIQAVLLSLVRMGYVDTRDGIHFLLRQAA
jgi:hypothetical protein